jgi:purine-cytosine permease-like protein
MFSYPNIWVTILAVFSGMAFIMFSVYYVNKLFINETKDVLVRFILLVFASLVGVFIVDKVIAFKINLLSDVQNEQLFDLIKTLTLMIFSYYFGTQKQEK